MTEYRLFRQQDSSYDGGGWGEPCGNHLTLAAAMHAAGHPDPADWETAVGIPDNIFIPWQLYYDPTLDYEDDEAHLFIPWTIEAPGVSAEFTEMLVPDDVSGLKP
jgi:hypothetical protein